MTFIIMTIIICSYGLLAEQQCKRLTEACAESEEAILRKPPGDLGRRLYALAGTFLNVGLMALSMFFYQDRAVYALKLAMILEWLIIIAYVDFFTGMIPNSLMLQGLGAALIFIVVEVTMASYPLLISLKDYFFGFLTGCGVFVLSAVISKGSIGMGDIKLFTVLGILLGLSAVFGLLFFTVLIAALAGIVVLLSGKGDKRTLMPLGPFTCVGMIVVLLMGV